MNGQLRLSVKWSSDLTEESIHPEIGGIIVTTFIAGQVLVNVRIIDVNNHVPVFQNNSYIFSVAENKPIGYTVGIVSAVDDDIGRSQSGLFRTHLLHFE